jgi:Fic family protein
MSNIKRFSQNDLDNIRFSQKINVFHGRKAPEEGLLVGSVAVTETLKLSIPLPYRLALISDKHRQYKKSGWLVFTPRHKPQDSLYGHLVFCLKYEGLNLLFLKKLFERTEEKVIEDMIKNEPLGQYSRKIWFLYEWLMGKTLQVPDLTEGNYIPLVDESLQYAIEKGVNSIRHRIRNNLPGTVDFCPMVNKTNKLDNYIKEDLSKKTVSIVHGVHNDILLRTSAFLLLKDSKASFNIEGETPSSNRASRWGRVIGQAGSKPLSKDELLRLQQIVIENQRFTNMGFRNEGGFVGEYERSTGEPIPEHISARWQDLDKLIKGLLDTDTLLEKSQFHPVHTAAIIAFGFVFIHPFSDGNGRIHRYLIHHMLAKLKFTPQGIIFPISAAILERIDDYRRVLESYSHPLLDFIEWERTQDNNVKVLNNTIDYYKYFDATSQVEFLFDCVDETINTIIPQELSYLKKYDNFKAWLDDTYEMPNKMVALLVRFLEQNSGKLSNRAKAKEFNNLDEKEIDQIESQYVQYFEE